MNEADPKHTLISQKYSAHEIEQNLEPAEPLIQTARSREESEEPSEGEAAFIA